MGVTLNISISTPLTPEDHELLSGVAMMTLAVAQYDPNAAKEESTETEPGPRPGPCGDLEYITAEDGQRATGRICISEVGHRGRHRYREAPVSVTGMN